MAKYTLEEVRDKYEQLGGVSSGASLEDVVDEMLTSGDTIDMEELNPLDVLSSKDFVPSTTMAGMGLNALEGIARAGRFATKGLKTLGETDPVNPELGGKIGQAIGDFTLPQTKMGVPLALFGGGAAGEELAGKKTVSAILSKTLGRKAQDIEKVIDNPKILDTTAEIAQKAYRKAVSPKGKQKLLGLKDSFLAGTGKAADKLTEEVKIDLINKAKLSMNGQNPDAQTILNGLQAVNNLVGSKAKVTLEEGIKEAFEGSLVRLGYKGIPRAGKIWGEGAIAKGFESLEPTKLDKTVDVGRATLAAGALGTGVEEAIRGRKRNSAVALGTAAMFSPLLMGQALKHLTPIVAELAKAGKPLTIASINAMLNKQGK